MLKFSGLADLISCYKRCDDRSSFQAASAHTFGMAAAREDSRSTFRIEHFSNMGRSGLSGGSGSSVARRPLCKLLYQAGDPMRCMCQTPGPSGTQRHTAACASFAWAGSATRSPPEQGGRSTETDLLLRPTNVERTKASRASPDYPIRPESPHPVRAPPARRRVGVIM